MPTPESAAAFTRLSAARARLNVTTKALNECHDELAKLSVPSAREKYKRLEAEWKEAYRAYEQAARDFNDAVKAIPEAVMRRAAQMPEEPNPN